MKRAAFLAACAIVAAIATATVVAAAGVTSRTTYSYHPLGGATARALVDSFRNTPISGDRGAALANLRYDQQLSLAARQSGGRCRVATLALVLNFTMTLPQAIDEGRMSKATRAAWRSAAAFARAHENWHRNHYLQCARSFVARARRVTAESCWAVETEVRRLLEASRAACERSEAGFERSQARRAGNLALFRMARAARR